jgi:hypothetical protein
LECQDDGVRVGQLVHGRDRHFGESGFHCFHAILFQNLVWNQLGHLMQRNLSLRHLFRAFYHGLRHFVDVTVHAVKNHLDFDAHTYAPVQSVIVAQISLL